VLGVVVRDCPERFLWLPRHTGVGRAPRSLKVRHEARTGHIEVEARVGVVRGDLREELRNKRTVDPRLIENPQVLGELAGCCSSFRTWAPLRCGRMNRPMIGI
jgi:hypothetical protein